MIVYPQVRTSADVLKSTIRLEQLIPFLQTEKAEACAIVNSKLYGLLPFWHAMKKASIHPVIGLHVTVQFDEEVQLPLVLYAQTNEGYQHLLKTSSAIAIRPDETLPIRWLQAYASGCVAVVPTAEKQFQWLQQLHEACAAQLKQIFDERLYIGISRTQKAQEQEVFVEQLATHVQSPIMVLQQMTFATQQDHFAFEVAQAIDDGIKLGDVIRTERTDGQYLMPRAEMAALYADRPEWLAQAADVLQSCLVDLQQNEVFMPKFPVAAGDSAEAMLTRQARAGLQYRLQSDHIPPAYEQRLQYELQVICSMGYADYFLIVEDFMRFAREAHILTGPGRGSAASSLIAYALQITQVDPLQYDLLFERFLNPERVSLPDIDIDFLDTRRQEVIQYVAEKYGKQYVAQIITFGTLSAKAVARDVARMFNFDSATLDMISKLIPNKTGITLREAYEQSAKLREWIEAEAIHRKWFDTALKLEGLPRNASTHAAGVVLSPIPLVDIVPIEQGHEGIYITQWPMQEVEQSGLLKMDFLGLRNLTIIEQVRKSILGTHEMAIDLTRIPFDDAKTFQLLQRGDTTGIFQLESDGMRKALREIQPTHFSDIVAVNALYRPGPMDFIPVYGRRKRGEEPVHMPHPALAPILQETYGVLIYQEQIMRIANVMAGFSIGEADLLRRAIGKKKRDVLEENEAKFVAGAITQGYDAQTAKEVYELIVRFADYGFAKSHAVAYSVITYQMAFLKANFPVNFYAALLTNATGNQDKLAQVLQEAKRAGISILPPSLHRSVRHFKVENGQIRFSLSAIKSVPQPFLQKLIEVRRAHEGPFEDIFDLALSLTGKWFTRKHIEPLVKAGALDEFGRDRSVLLATIDAAVMQAELIRPDGEEDLFASSMYAFGKPKHIQVAPMPEKIKLNFEKEVLGFYLSAHPAAKVRAQYPTIQHTLHDLTSLRDGSFVHVLGTIIDVRQIRTKKGEPMCFVQIEDETETLSLTLFPQVYLPFFGRLKEGQYVVAEGVLENRFNQLQMKVRQLHLLQDGQET